jgi:hypothetical protein
LTASPLDQGRDSPMTDEKQSSDTLLGFLWKHKVWWLAPALSVLAITGLLLYFGRSTASSPFVYTLF